MPVMPWSKGTLIESGNPELKIENIHESRPPPTEHAAALERGRE